MAQRNLPHQGQAQAHATFTLGVAGKAEEGLEDAFAVGVGHAGAAVADLDHGARRCAWRRGLHTDADFVAAVTPRVFQQVAQRTAQQAFITLDLQVLPTDGRAQPRRFFGSHRQQRHRLRQVKGDERLLRRALRNLLENARRYGGNEVSVSVEAAPPGAAPGAVIKVCDRGPGVPDIYRERIFEPFFRLPGHAEREGGVGLGLALVRQIALRHGGQVRCEPRDGGGSCFVLTLPAA